MFSLEKGPFRKIKTLCILLVIMCEMIYIGVPFRFYGELLRKILSRR